MKTLFQLHKQKEIELGHALSYEDVASVIGIGRSTYVFLMSGKLTPRSKSISQPVKDKLMAYFGVDKIKLPKSEQKTKRKRKVSNKSSLTC